MDKGINILKALKLIESFDVDLFSTVIHRFYKIEHHDVEEFARLLRDVLGVYLGTLNTDVKTIPIKQLNLLLVMSQRQQVFDTVTQLLKTLDVPNETAQPRLYVYPVKNGEAEELAELLDAIFTSKTTPRDVEKTPAAPETDKPPMVKTSSNPFAISVPQKESSAKGGDVVSGVASASDTLKGEIKITADKIRNTLIIEAVPSDFLIVKNILQQLDVLPRQVLIEAMIAEITLDDKTQFGVEWTYVKGDGGSLSTSLLSATMGASGMRCAMSSGKPTVGGPP